MMEHTTTLTQAFLHLRLLQEPLLEKVFQKHKPAITTNKWKLGHTFATSGLLSLELAVLMLQHQELIRVPYLEAQEKIDKIRNILVNAVGFGGNAVSVLVSLPK